MENQRVLTIIRPARHDDLGRLAEIGAVLHSESERFRRCRYAPEKVLALMSALMQSANGLVLVVEKDGEVIGGIAATVVEQWYSFDRIATDISVFILPEHRGGTALARLLNAYREWAESRGAVYALAGISTSITVARTQSLYEALGARYVGPMMEFSMKGGDGGN